MRHTGSIVTHANRMRGDSHVTDESACLDRFGLEQFNLLVLGV